MSTQTISVEPITCPQCKTLLNPVSHAVSHPVPPPAAHRSAEWIPLIRSAVQEVFEKMLGCEVVDRDAAPLEKSDLSAMVGLAGELVGMMAVCCDKPAACAVAGRMLGEEPPEIDDCVRDALGEVCNMVAGSFKARVPGLEKGCSLSVPTVLTGADYRLHSLAGVVHFAVSFSFDGLPFWITLDLHE